MTTGNERPDTPTAADDPDLRASQLVPGTGCTAHLEPGPHQNVTLRATHATGQGRWLSAPHPLDGTVWPTDADAVRAAAQAGLLVAPAEDDKP